MTYRNVFYLYKSFLHLFFLWGRENEEQNLQILATIPI